MSSAFYSFLVRGLATDVSGSLGGDACEDFAEFSFRYPSSTQLVEWCIEGVGRIKDEPLDAAADERAVQALTLVASWLLKLEEVESRAMVAHDLWRAYADISRAEGAARALEGLDRGDESWADRANAAMRERWDQAC